MYRISEAHAVELVQSSHLFCSLMFNVQRQLSTTNHKTETQRLYALLLQVALTFRGRRVEAAFDDIFPPLMTASRDVQVNAIYSRAKESISEGTKRDSWWNHQRRQISRSRLKRQKQSTLRKNHLGRHSDHRSFTPVQVGSGWRPW